jgi:methionine synthase II (cobalamin-independent)
MTTVEPPAGAAGGPGPDRDGRAELPTVPPLGDALRPGACTGIGSLPHRAVHEAAAFALREYDLPAIPTLPRRSPAEGMIAQALVGIGGVTLGQYGSIAVDADHLDPAAPVATDIGHDAYGALRAFLADASARQLRGPVKWQFTGPVTLGAALTRVGVPADRAFAVAAAAVRAHVAAIATAVAAALPASPQVVWLDEPWFGDLMSPGFPIAPDPAIDLLSTAMAMLEPVATVGVHCCADADVASLLAAGPAMLSIPLEARLVDVAGYLTRFLEDGGRIAWGVIPTDGPIAVSADRPWRLLSEVWCELVNRGCDPVELRQRSLVTPACGLGLHTPSVAERVVRLGREIGRKVNDQAVASRFALGA